MRVVIVSGKRGEGKTTFLIKCVEELQRRNRALFGFYAENVKTPVGSEGYRIIKVGTGESLLLCQRDHPISGNLRLADFWFDERAIASGEQWLREGFVAENPIFILDEAGKFELDGHVWDNSIKQLLQLETGTLVITVRDRFLTRVMEKYQLDKANSMVTDDLLFTVELVDKIERG